MEPQHSLQPDQPDDDPDQDADQPPPSTALLDSALSLVAQPLASAAARVAAAHPIPLPLDDLNNFNVDLSWAAPDIDSLFLNDTQYLQLGDDNPSSSPTPFPPASLPAQLPSASATATVTIAHPTPDSQSQPTTSLADPPTTSHPQSQNDLPSPIPPTLSSAAPQKRSRPRLAQPPPQQTPIPIAPRTVTNRNKIPDLKIKSSPPTLSSTEAHSSPLYTTRPKSAPPVQSPDRSPASVSLETGSAQSHPNTVAQFPVPMSTHPMMPLMNMYPLQHYQSMFHPSPPALSPANPSTPDSKFLQPPVTSDPADTNNAQLPGVHRPPSASQHRSQHPSGAHQQFLSPTMQVMPQGVVSYDTAIMPFFQMAYAAAAARYPQGVIPPIPPGSSNVPSTMLNPFAPSRPQCPQNPSAQNIPTTNPNTSTINHTDLQSPGQQRKREGAPVLVRDGGTQVLVPQQKPARLERHPVLGRLQLKSTSKPQVATSSGMNAPFASESQTSSGENHQSFPGSVPGAASASRPGPSSLSSPEGGQRQQKRRLVWTPELHDRFVKAISAVGLSQAVPKMLVTIMNVEGLTTEHVKSHLQKYRNSLRKEAAEEDRDWSRGAGPAGGQHGIKLGTPGASGASVIHSAGSESGRQAVSSATNAGGLQGLPILQSRINAFGGQVRGLVLPGPEAKTSAKGTKPSSAPQPAREQNQPERRRSHSPRLPSMPHPTGADASRENSGGTGVVSQPSKPPTTTRAQTDRIVAEIDGGAPDGENIKGIEREGTAGKALADARDVDERISDRAVAASAPPEAPSAKAENGRSPSVGTQVMLQKQGADLRTGEGSCSNVVRQGDNEDMNVGASPGAVAENVPSASQSSRDLELELMKEQTQQMQLQVQMMIYRTIAVEKKLQEVESERVNAEASGTADASKRSTVGEADCSGRQGEEGEMKKDNCSVNKVDAKERVASDESAVGEPRGAKRGSTEEEIGRAKKRRHGATRKGDSELKVLLNEQMGLQKRIEDGLAMIDKRMRREVVDLKEGSSGSVRTDKEGKQSCQHKRSGDKNEGEC